LAAWAKTTIIKNSRLHSEIQVFKISPAAGTPKEIDSE